MHKTIKRFGLDGEVKDNADFAVRHGLVDYVVREMRDAGYVPVVGLGPFWSFEFDVKKVTFRFTLSVHGVYVGRKKACHITGVTVEGRTLTLPSKSEPS